MSAENPIPEEATESKVEQEESKEGERPPYNGIIVFGHGYRAERERLSVEARIRVLAAYQLWKDGVADRIIVTGGPASDQDKAKFGQDLTSNGEHMRDYLINELGVPADQVEFENQSTKTVDNVGHALNKLREKGLPEDNFVTVSTWYHMRRIALIMKNFGLQSAAVGAEDGLLSRAREHAEKMRERELTSGVPIEKVDMNYHMRLHRYDRMMDRLKLSDPGLIGELQNEDWWLEAMKEWGYWGPLALAVKGEKLQEIVGENRADIEAWLERHPDLGLTTEEMVEGLLEGSLDYKELVDKAREVPKKEDQQK